MSSVCGDIRHSNLSLLILCVFCGSTVHPKCSFRLKDVVAWSTLVRLADRFTFHARIVVQYDSDQVPKYTICPNCAQGPNFLFPSFCCVSNCDSFKNFHPSQICYHKHKVVHSRFICLSCQDPCHPDCCVFIKKKLVLPNDTFGVTHFKYWTNYPQCLTCTGNDMQYDESYNVVRNWDPANFPRSGITLLELSSQSCFAITSKSSSTFLKRCQQQE